MRLYNGIQRRYRVLSDTSRTRDYMYLAAHWSEKSGPLPGSPQEWCPHAWDPQLDKEWLKQQGDASRALLERCRAENEATE